MWKKKAFEGVLRGIDGVKHVKVNVLGDPVRLPSAKPIAKKRKTIYLTLDLELRKTARSGFRTGLGEDKSGRNF